ncbi:serine hydrolase [Actinomycetospora termitidis]|uniref:Serine hydrolase n=1 Tax=Actinomycetospora termitidis TaxID=3053470 RepID=A0ABT7ME05_9PSEU|nr:serine hydrolase [Actinomycetospora sp. Odt1-22]MDL5158896.1 serine hydrolase [Actinomycetospora sp. Odt1-22]
MSRSWRAAGLCVLAAVVVSCAPAPAPVAAPPPVTTAASAPVEPSRAQEAVDAADASVTRAGATVGIAVLDRTTGSLAVNDAGSEPFNSASLSKVLTVLDALRGGQVTDADRELIRAALGPSDDDAMNTLWSRFGGQAGITRVSEALGLQDTTAPDDPSQWGEVQLSPRDMTSVFRYVVEGLAPVDRDLVLDALGAAPAQAADGFDQAFGLLDPSRRGPADAKQGWLCCLDEAVDLHSAGLLAPADRYVVAILSRQPYGYPAARQVLDDAAAAIRDVVGDRG